MKQLLQKRTVFDEQNYIFSILKQWHCKNKLRDNLLSLSTPVQSRIFVNATSIVHGQWFMKLSLT